LPGAPAMSDNNVLLVEPYYGGSHKRFVDGLATYVDANFSLLSLPPRKWKMRMQLSAPHFINELRKIPTDERCFDTVLFSTFVDAAVFRALTACVDGWNDRCRYLSYFHENQFCYPGYLGKRTNHQFTAINFSTSLVSDEIGFNSAFNRNSFLSECRTYLGKAADMDITGCLEEVEKKSRVLYPGIDFSGIDEARSDHGADRSKLIIWNHRWEHDKNPEEFFETLYRLVDDGVDFNLCVMGETFKNRPACFAQARERLHERIVHWGYVEDRTEYYCWLAAGDIVVSTALHEFYGMSVIEAVRAGCRPVLPKRLSYPELFSDEFLYDEGDLGQQLKVLLAGGTNFKREQGLNITEPYSWESRQADFSRWLSSTDCLENP